MSGKEDINSILEQAVASLGRPANEAERFKALFAQNWLESLEDYMEHHDAPQIANQVPVKLHSALVQMARDRNVKGLDRRDRGVELRSDSAPFVMSTSQPVFQPTRNASSVVPSIVKHMPGSLSVSAAPFVSSFSSPAAPAAVPSPSLSLFGSSIWGPDASSWSVPATVDASAQRRGPLGSLIVNSSSNGSIASPVGPASLSSSPTLEFFVPSLLGDDAMDELNDETFASSALDVGDDDWAAESEVTSARDLAMRQRFSQSLAVSGANDGAVSLQTVAPLLVAGADVKQQVTAATTFGGVVEEEKKISRREQKKKRLEERKRLQLLEKAQQAQVPSPLVSEVQAPAVAVSQPKSMQWKDVVAKAAPNPPPPAPVGASLPPVATVQASKASTVVASSGPSAAELEAAAAEERRLRVLEKKRADEKKLEEKEKAKAEVRARREKQGKLRLERKKEREVEAMAAKRRELQDWWIDLKTCKHSPEVPVACRLCESSDDKTAREQTVARRVTLMNELLAVKKAAALKREDEEQTAIEILAAALVKKDLTYARNICNRWRQKGYCVGGRKCQYDHPEEWKGMGARGDEPGTDVFDLARKERKESLEAERLRFLAAKNLRKANAAKARGDVLDEKPKLKKSLAKKLASRVAIPYPEAVPSTSELVQVSSASKMVEKPKNGVGKNEPVQKVGAKQKQPQKAEQAHVKKEPEMSGKKEAEKKPSVVEKKPIVEKIPAVVEKKLSVVEKKPSVVDEKPSVVEKKPSVVEKKPVEKIPAVVEKELAAVAVAQNADGDVGGDVEAKKGRKKKKKKKGKADPISVSEETPLSVPQVPLPSPPEVVIAAPPPPPRRVLSVVVSMELFEEVSVVVAKKNVYEDPPRSIETALVVAKLISACSFSAVILVAGANLPSAWKEGDSIVLTVPEREVADAPLRQGEPLSGIVIWSSPDASAELSVICNRIGQGPLGTSSGLRSVISLAAKGDSFDDVLPHWVSGALNWFAGLKYECLLVDTEHQEFCRDCAGAVLDFIKPPKDLDAAGLARLRAWLPRLSGLVGRAPIPQRQANAREMARICFAASVTAPGSTSELDRLTVIRDKVLAHLRHDEWPTIVELHFNPVPSSAAMGEDFAVESVDAAKLFELQFNELVDRCFDELQPQNCLARSAFAKRVAGPIPLLVHWQPASEKGPLLLFAAHDWTPSMIIMEAYYRFDPTVHEATNWTLVLRRPGNVVQALENTVPLRAYNLLPGDHLWIEDVWDTPIRLSSDAYVPPVAEVTEAERGIREIAKWKENGIDFVSFTYFIRITKHAARYPLVVVRASELPDPLATIFPEDRALLKSRLVGVERATDPMEAYLCHLNYWMDLRSPSGAGVRGMLAQPVAFTLNMDDPPTLAVMSPHEVRERIVYGEWDVENEDSSSAGEETEGSSDTEEVAEQWEALCEGCKFDNARKHWNRCDQCGLINPRSRSNKKHNLAELPDLNTVVYWNKEWHLASSKQYESRKRILSISAGEIWVDRLRAFVAAGGVAQSVVEPTEETGQHEGDESAGLVAFSVRTSDADPKQTQKVSLRFDQHAELEPLEVELDLLLTTSTGSPVGLNELWTETPESEPRHPYIWIFGDPGVGKSWLSRHMCRLFNDTGMLSSWRERFDAVTRVFLPDLLRSCSQYGDLITSKELLDTAWSLCNPGELGLNTVRVGSAYERRTDRVLWILDGYDEAERMLDLENRRPGTNFRFMQGLATSSLYYLQNAIIFTRAAPELELVSGTRLVLRGIAPQNPPLSRLFERLSEPLQSTRPTSTKSDSMVSFEDLKDALEIARDLAKEGTEVTTERLSGLPDALRNLIIVDQGSYAHYQNLMIVAKAACENGDLKEATSAIEDDQLVVHYYQFARLVFGAFQAFKSVAQASKSMFENGVRLFQALKYLACAACDCPPTTPYEVLMQNVERRIMSHHWRRRRTDLLHFVERHVIRGFTRKERLETAARWIEGWKSVPVIASLLHNPLHVKLLCRIQRSRADVDDGVPWYNSADLPCEPRELLISELHRHAITPILLRKENFDFAAGTVFGELELVKAQPMEDKSDVSEASAPRAFSSLASDWPQVNSALSATATAAAASATAAAATAASDVGSDLKMGSSSAAASLVANVAALGLPRDSIESQSVREFLISLWYMANPNNQPPLPRPSSKDQRWLFLLCLTPPTERWNHVLAVAAKLRDRIFRCKVPATISAPEDIKSLGSPDVTTLLELLRVAHALDRNASVGDSDPIFDEPMDVALLHILREVLADEPWLNSMQGGLISLPPISVPYQKESGFWLCKAPFRHHSALVRMPVPSIVAWSASFKLLPAGRDALPQGVAFSPCTQLDHLIVNHDITNPLIRPDSVFNTGSETGFVCPNVVQDLMVVSPASESPSDWPMCWSCGDVTVDGIGCRICRRQHHAFCARKGRKLICTQCSHQYPCWFYTESRWCPRCGSDKLCIASATAFNPSVPSPFTCTRCRGNASDGKSDVVYPFVQELFLQAAASMGLRAVVLAALHPSYRPLEVLDRWVSCAFHSAAMHGHQELADEIAKLFQSPSSATNLMRGIVRFRAGRGLSIEGCSQYSLLFFSPDAHGSTPLHLAAFGGHADVVQMLLQKGQKSETVNASTTYGSTPLHEAALQGSVEVISLLQKAGAQLMAKNRLGETALHLAVSQGRVEVAEYLLDVCPALLNTADTAGNHALHLACIAGSLECASVLLSRGADVGLPGSHDQTPLHLLCQSARCSDAMVSLLLSKGAKPLSVCKKGRTALAVAAKSGLTGAVKLMLLDLQRSSSVDFLTGAVLTLLEACRHNHDRIVELVVGLKDRKVPLDETSFYGAPPLTLAMRAGNVRMAKLLLEAGAMTSVADNRGNLPIHAACMAGEAKLVELIIKHESQVSNLFASNDELFTPLHLACKRGNSRIVRLLVECVNREISKEKKKGEDSESAIPKPKRGRSSFILFVQANRSEALERHPDLESNKMLMTILQDMWNALPAEEQRVYEELASAEKKHQDELILQWQEKASLNSEKPFSSFLALCASGPGGMTPLHLAAVNGHADCVVILLGALLKSGDAKFRVNLNAVVTTPELRDTSTITEVCSKGLSSIAALLLDVGPGRAFVNHAGSDLRTPLFAACLSGSATTVLTLLQRGATVHWCDREKQTPLFVACQRRKNAAVIRLLVHYGARDPMQKTVLANAFAWCCASGAPFAENALALLQAAGTELIVTHIPHVPQLQSWMNVELERLVLREDSDELEADDPAPHMLMVQLLERAADPSYSWHKQSSLPVRLVLLATQHNGFKYCRAWLHRFMQLGAIRVDADVLVDAKAMDVPSDVIELLDGAQKKQLESIKSSFLPDTAQKPVVKKKAVKKKGKKTK